VAPGREAHLVEANVDDVTPEVLAHTVATLLTVGAFDAWVTPIVMKKGRPAHTVHALCDASTLQQVLATVVAETGTLGVRASTVERWPQRRDDAVVQVAGLPVRVKRAAQRIKVEIDDATEVAQRTGRPLRDVVAEAERAAQAASVASAEATHDS
jgi:hypothetical protein